MPTPDKNKAALEGLIAKANAATGGADTTVTDAVDTLIAGFGQGGESINPLEYATFLGGQVFRNTVFPENTKLYIKLNQQSSVSDYNLANQFGYARNLVSIEFDFSELIKGVNLASVLTGARELKEVIITGNNYPFIAISGAFSDCPHLETITGTLNSSANYSNTFKPCGALKDVRFAENSIQYDITFAWSNKLTDASVQSIIDGLADRTGTTALTLTLHADVKSKLTEAQISAITDKNWTLA